MTDQHTGMNLFNVQASINSHLSTYLSTVPFHTWAGARPSVIFWLPDTQIVLPSFAIAHLPSRFEGMGHALVGEGRKGTKVSALVEISCFVSKEGPRWAAQLSHMVDLTLMSLSVGAIIVYDYATDPSSATPPVGGKVTLDGGRVVPLYTEDPSPTIARSRVLGEYFFSHQTQL